MDMTVTLGRLAISNDYEHVGLIVSQMFTAMMGDRLEWFEENYPNLVFVRNVAKDPVSYQDIYEWYVVFNDTISLAHYKLTFG